jgi:hypothetical protein
MKIFYKILSFDATTNSALIRYYSDTLSENALASVVGDTAVSPERCRSDINLTFFSNIDTPEKMHDYIISHAPVTSMEILENPTTLFDHSLVADKVGIEIAAERTLSLDEQKQKALRFSTQKYYIAIQEPVTYMGTEFDATIYSQNLMSQTLSTSEFPADFSWLDKSNVFHPMTKVELTGLSNAILARNFAEFTKLQDTKTIIKSATTEEELTPYLVEPVLPALV